MRISSLIPCLLEWANTGLAIHYQNAMNRGSDDLHLPNMQAHIEYM